MAQSPSRTADAAGMLPRECLPKFLPYLFRRADRQWEVDRGQPIPRFYDAHAGTVKIDGRSVCDYKLKALRDQIWIYMLQDPVLFASTIKENIAFGHPSYA